MIVNKGNIIVNKSFISLNQEGGNTISCGLYKFNHKVKFNHVQILLG